MSISAELRHYLWDRVARAAIRDAVMTDAQKVALSEWIQNEASDEADLISAAEALVAGTLDKDEAIASYRANRVDGFSVEVYRRDVLGAASAGQNQLSEIDQEMEAVFG